LLSSQRTEAVRTVRREYSKRIAKSSTEIVIELASRLVDRSQSPFRFVAYELVLHHKEALSCLDAKKLESLGRGINDWVAVDTFACYLAGPAWRARQVPDRLITWLGAFARPLVAPGGPGEHRSTQQQSARRQWRCLAHAEGL
jgi:hypothetical protein